ncbi:MAG: thioredoxin-dependent thiol peroxidase [Mycobacteriales bacterium]
MVRPQPGDAAPAFTLPDANGRPVALSDFAGRRLILYFYPAALTPGCTLEAGQFRDAVPALTAAGIAVVGVSPDPPDVLRRFRDQENLPYPLLSDPDREVLERYGAYGEKTVFGTSTVGVIRSTFVIDRTGRVEHVYERVDPAVHVAQLRTDLKV